MGLSVWNQDEAGPYQTKPYPGSSWHPKKNHNDSPMNTFGTERPNPDTFHPASGKARVKGVTSSANAILHPWLKEELSMILQTLPPPKEWMPKPTASFGKCGRRIILPITLPENLPDLRMLLIWDNLRGHYTTEMILWLFNMALCLCTHPWEAPG